LVILTSYDYYITTFDENNHYESNILRVEKYDPQKVWTLVMWDADNRCYNLKRSLLEARPSKQNLLGDTERFQMATIVDGNKLSIDVRRQGLPLLSDVPYPRFRVTLGKPDDFRPALEIEAERILDGTHRLRLFDVVAGGVRGNFRTSPKIRRKVRPRLGRKRPRAKSLFQSGNKRLKHKLLDGWIV